MAADPDNELPSLAELGKQIDQARSGGQSGPKPLLPVKGMDGVQLAIRAIAEVISGIIAGTALGFFLDRWLDTSPWLFILGFLLGSAASGLNIYRLASRKKSDMN